MFPLKKKRSLNTIKINQLHTIICHSACDYRCAALVQIYNIDNPTKQSEREGRQRWFFPDLFIYFPPKQPNDSTGCGDVRWQLSFEIWRPSRGNSSSVFGNKLKRPTGQEDAQGGESLKQRRVAPDTGTAARSLREELHMEKTGGGGETINGIYW